MPRLVDYFNLNYRLKDTSLPNGAKEVAENLFHSRENHMHVYSFFKDDKVQMRATGYYLANEEYVLHRTNGIDGAGIKAYALYHRVFHLVKCPCHSDSGHSIGGKRIWLKLATYPDLDIKHYSYNKFGGQEVDFPLQEQTFLPFYRGEEIDKNWNLVKLPYESRFLVQVATPKS